MTSIRIGTKLEDETLVLPELRPLIGKTVDIEITERLEAQPADRWAAAAEAVRHLADYDFDAWSDQRSLGAGDRVAHPVSA